MLGSTSGSSTNSLGDSGPITNPSGPPRPHLCERVRLEQEWQIRSTSPFHAIDNYCNQWALFPTEPDVASESFLTQHLDSTSSRRQQQS